MGIFSRFEDKMEDTVEGAASRVSKAPISPVQIAKKAEKQMRRETMVGAGKQYAPTLYTVLVNPDDDDRLFGYYPTLAGETETYLSAKAEQDGLVMDGNPLVRFIVDDNLRHGKFDVIAEVVAAPIIAQLREEEMERYGIAQQRPQQQRQSQPLQRQQQRQQQQYDQRYDQQQYDQQYEQLQRKPPLPYVPEEEIDRSIDYGEYTFNSEDFEDYRTNSPSGHEAPLAYNDAAVAADAAVAGMGAAGAAIGRSSQPLVDSYANSQPVPDSIAHANSQPVPDNYRPQQGRASQQQRERQYQQPNTMVFSDGAGQQPQSGNVANRRPVRARLVDRASGRPYDLTSARVTLGREKGNLITVPDINASRRHAELTLNNQGLWVITDLGSMNGTLVNGVSVASQPLYPGDLITIGRTDFEFTLA